MVPLLRLLVFQRFANIGLRHNCMAPEHASSFPGSRWLSMYPTATGTKIQGKPAVSDGPVVTWPRQVALNLRLLFVQIFTGHVVLRHLMRANFFFIRAVGVFHADHCVGLECIPFGEQLVDTLRIRGFETRQAL